MSGCRTAIRNQDSAAKRRRQIWGHLRTAASEGGMAWHDSMGASAGRSLYGYPHPTNFGPGSRPCHHRQRRLPGVSPRQKQTRLVVGELLHRVSVSRCRVFLDRQLLVMLSFVTQPFTGCARALLVGASRRPLPSSSVPGAHQP